MPFSNDKGEGFENKIAKVLGEAMGAKVSFSWRPFLERGLTRQTFDAGMCDVMIDIPALRLAAHHDADLPHHIRAGLPQ